MEKIKLNSGKEFELIVCGILTYEDNLTLKFLPGDNTLDALNTIFTDTTETSKITLLSESGEELSIHNGYTELVSIQQEINGTIGSAKDDNGEYQPVTGKLVTVVLKKEDAISARITKLESRVSDTQMALCELYEDNMTEEEA